MFPTNDRKQFLQEGWQRAEPAQWGGLAARRTVITAEGSGMRSRHRGDGTCVGAAGDGRSGEGGMY